MQKCYSGSFKFALSLIMLASSKSVLAAEAINPILDDKYTFLLGGIHNDLEGTITVLDQPLPETPIDIKTVGLDTTQTSPWAAFRWRFGERWALNFHYDRFDQDGKAKVDKTFNFDGVVFPAGALIDTKLRADAYVFDVSYAVFKQPNYEAGLGLGIHAFDLDMGISGTLAVGDKTLLFGPEAEEFIAPVPNARVFGTYAFNRKVAVSANAGWLSMNYENWDGDFLYIEAHVEYRFSDHWGAGIGYQFTMIDLEHNRDNGDFEHYDIDLDGAQVYITYSF